MHSSHQITYGIATPYLPKELLKLIYTALFRSHMEYCSVIFSSAAKTHLKKLMSYREKLHTSYIEYHVMPMLIYYCCFSNWKILVTDEKTILSSLLNHLSQENVTQQCLRLLTCVQTEVTKPSQLVSPGPLLAHEDRLCLVPPSTTSI